MLNTTGVKAKIIFFSSLSKSAEALNSVPETRHKRTKFLSKPAEVLSCPASSGELSSTIVTCKNSADSLETISLALNFYYYLNQELPLYDGRPFVPAHSTPAGSWYRCTSVERCENGRFRHCFVPSEEPE